MPFTPHILDNDLVSSTFFRMNTLYRGVMDENQKVTFQADVYSSEFLSFMPKLLKIVYDSLDRVEDQTKKQSLQIAHKVSFDIMVRLP